MRLGDVSGDSVVVTLGEDSVFRGAAGGVAGALGVTRPEQTECPVPKHG